MRRIIIAVMPFGTLERPAMAPSMLVGRLNDAGQDCRVDYANLRFADRIGIAAYDFFSRRTDCTDLMGEWLFSRAAFGRQPGQDAFFDEVVRTSAKSMMLMRSTFGESEPGNLRAILDGYARTAETFVDECARDILRQNPDVVAATTIFQQNCAALALLRRVKELRPEVRTVLGGANCEEPMGTALEELCPWVDHVHKGRAEGHLNRIFALAGPDGGQDADGSAAHPDFADYFDQLGRAACRSAIYPALPIEMSTGCWYGEKSHCTFCGLNGTTMAFRFRDADEVLEEIRRQKDRYGLDKFMAVDNIIAIDYFRTLLPKLVETGTKISMFVETKANLKAWQLDLMRDAGFGWIQPGIESLSNTKLKRFRKGTDLRTNLTLLKGAMERGIAASWLLLVNDPGDNDDEYKQMAELFPKIRHLMPPANIVPVRFDRYSPYHFRAEEFGLKLEPYRSYSCVYPSGAALDRLAYYFEDYGYPRANHTSPSLAPLYAAMQAWTNAFYGVRNASPSRLVAHTQLSLDRDAGIVVDRRDPDRPADHPVDADEIAMLDRLDEGLTKARYRSEFASFDLGRLLDLALVIDAGEHYLSLVTKPPTQSLPAFEDFPCGAIWQASAA